MFLPWRAGGLPDSLLAKLYVSIFSLRAHPHFRSISPAVQDAAPPLSPSPPTRWDGSYCGQRTQGTWGGGQAGRWPLPSPPAGCPHSRDEDQNGQPWVWGHRGSFGETQKQGCRMPPTVPSSRTQHVWAQYGCRGSGGPGRDREEHTVLAPQEGTWAGSSRPALSLFHPFSPFHNPLGITVSLQTKQSRGDGRAEKGTAGD